MWGVRGGEGIVEFVVEGVVADVEIPAQLIPRCSPESRRICPVLVIDRTNVFNVPAELIGTASKGDDC